MGVQTSHDTRELIERAEVASLLAERDGDVIGYLSAGPGESKGVATLGAVYVEPNHWGEGAGTARLDAFEAVCSREGYERIQLNVLSENELGVSCYDSRGYDATAEQTTELFGEPVHERHYSGRVSAAASTCDSQLP